MEKFELTLQSPSQITAYGYNNHLIAYERGIYNEMLTAISNQNVELLNWFASFGDSFRSITMNVHAYRKGLEFGFTDIAFNQHGWFERQAFLETEEFCFGDKSRYGSHSIISLGRGINHIWTFGMHYNYGVAGGCYGLSVYGKQFKSREAALTFAINEL